jgi:hypothetical protein
MSRDRDFFRMDIRNCAGTVEAHGIAKAHGSAYAQNTRCGDPRMTTRSLLVAPWIAFSRHALAAAAFAMPFFTAPALTADDANRVELIMENLPPAASKDYKALRGVAGPQAKGQALTMTKAEMWSVPPERVEELFRAALLKGVKITRLGSDWNHMFKSAPQASPMSDAQKSMMEMAKQSPSTMGVGMMSSPPATVVEYALTKGMNSTLKLAEDPRIVIPLGDGTSITVRRTRIDLTKDGCIWTGEVEETGEMVTLMWWSGGRLAGNINYKGMKYSVRNMGGDAHAVIGINPKMMPPEHGAMPGRRADDPSVKDDPLVATGEAMALKPFMAGHPGNAPRRKLTEEELRNLQDSMSSQMRKAADKRSQELAQSTAQSRKGRREPVTITMMVAYTPKAARHYTKIENDLIALAVEETNQSFRLSKLGHIRVELVHTVRLDYDEAGKAHFDHLFDMVDKVPPFRELHKLRDEKKADVVILVVDDPGGCGLATRVAATAEEAFAIVHHECAASTYSLAHELGHLIGARHDRALDQSKGPFPFGHGYVNGSKWRTMMAYKNTCNDCPRLPIWSNPEVRIKGERAGDREHNNAKVILEQAERVARFR